MTLFDGQYRVPIFILGAARDQSGELVIQRQGAFWVGPIFLNFSISYESQHPGGTTQVVSWCAGPRVAPRQDRIESHRFPPSAYVTFGFPVFSPHIGN